MKIKLNNKQFLDVANVVAKSISSKEQQSQTSFKIENDEKMIITHLASTSLFKGSVDIVEMTEQEGEEPFWVVSGQQLKLILSVIPKESEFVTLEIEQGGTQFTITSGESKLKLPISEIVANYKEKPLINLGEIGAHDFLSSISSLTKLILNDDLVQNYPISCLHLFGKKDKLVFMSTSLSALAEKTIKFDSNADKDFTILIKPTQANLLQSSLFAPDDIITLYQTEDMFGYIDKNGVLCLVSKTDLNPLNYLQFKEAVSNEEEVELFSSQLKTAVDNLSKLCNNNSDIILSVEGSKLIVENASNDTIKLPFQQGNAENVRMPFNRHSLTSLTSILPEKIKLGWKSGDGKKIILVNCLDNEGKEDKDTFLIITTNER